MRTGPIASVIAAIISAGGAFGGYMYFKPKDLKNYLQWKGYTLASFDEENIWKSIYEENKDNFNRDFVDVKFEEKDKWKAVKEYCIKSLKKADYSSEINKATTWCLDDVKTVKGQLVKNGKGIGDLMQEEKEFKVAVAVQGNPDFWKLIGADGKGFKEKTDAYEKWCKESFVAEPKNNLVGNVDNFCRKKPYSSFKQKLEHDGYVGLTHEQMKEQYTKLGIDKLKKGDTSRYLVEIMLGEEKLEAAYQKWGVESVNKEDFGNNYIFYCSQFERFDVGSENYSEQFSKYVTLCGIKKEEKAKG